MKRACFLTLLAALARTMRATGAPPGSDPALESCSNFNKRPTLCGMRNYCLFERPQCIDKPTPTNIAPTPADAVDPAQAKIDFPCHRFDNAPDTCNTNPLLPHCYYDPSTGTCLQCDNGFDAAGNCLGSRPAKSFGHPLQIPADELTSPLSMNFGPGGRPAAHLPGKDYAHCIKVGIVIDKVTVELFGNEIEAELYFKQLLEMITPAYMNEWKVKLRLSDFWVWDQFKGATGEARLMEIQKLFTKGQYKNKLQFSNLIMHATSKDLDGGGIAWMNGLFSYQYQFAVALGLEGGFSKWDKMVVAHELAHGFGAEHTHDIGIDQCHRRCTSDIPMKCDPGSAKPLADEGGYCGSIMSYCHICTTGLGGGGMDNIIFHFHDQNAQTVDKMFTRYTTNYNLNDPCEESKYDINPGTEDPPQHWDLDDGFFVSADCSGGRFIESAADCRRAGAARGFIANGCGGYDFEGRYSVAKGCYFYHDTHMWWPNCVFFSDHPLGDQGILDNYMGRLCADSDSDVTVCVPDCVGKCGNAPDGCGGRCTKQCDSCVDKTLMDGSAWKDADSNGANDCLAYEAQKLCSPLKKNGAQSVHIREGMSALDACCACGGGKQTCVDLAHPNTDGVWLDDDGFQCSSYTRSCDGGRALESLDYFESFVAKSHQISAAVACCRCGGGDCQPDLELPNRYCTNDRRIDGGMDPGSARACNRLVEGMGTECNGNLFQYGPAGCQCVYQGQTCEMLLSASGNAVYRTCQNKTHCDVDCVNKTCGDDDGCGGSCGDTCDCEDTPDFLDARRFPCMAWNAAWGFFCGDEANLCFPGYTEPECEDIRYNCTESCGLCGTKYDATRPDPTSPPTKAPTVTSSPTTAPTATNPPTRKPTQTSLPPTHKPTEVPVPTEVPTQGVTCVDMAHPATGGAWTDDDGDGCSAYLSSCEAGIASETADYYMFWASHGLGAHEACCRCGGGVKSSPDPLDICDTILQVSGCRSEIRCKWSSQKRKCLRREAEAVCRGQFKKRHRCRQVSELCRWDLAPILDPVNGKGACVVLSAPMQCFSLVNGCKKFHGQKDKCQDPSIIGKRACKWLAQSKRCIPFRSLQYDRSC